MSNFTFVPEVGMRTNNCYLSGIGENEDICCEGFIEHVGKDYFVLRNETNNTVRLIRQTSYWCIENDFTQ